MEMWLRLTTLVLLTVAVMLRPAPGELNIHVVSTETSISVGSCVTLSCCADKNNSSKHWLQWFKSSEESKSNETDVTNSSRRSTGAQRQCPQNEKKKQNCPVTLDEYTILNARQNDSGFYFCKVTVDIPILQSHHSKGLHISVTKNLKDNTTYPSLTTTDKQEPLDSFTSFSWWIWIILGVSCLVILVLVITCILKKSCTTSEPEEPIYSNTHNRQPSPRPRTPMENIKAPSLYPNSLTPNPGRRYDNDTQRQYRNHRQQL